MISLGAFAIGLWGFLWWLGRPWLDPQTFVGQPVTVVEQKYGKSVGSYYNLWDRTYDINCVCGWIDSYYLGVQLDAHGNIVAAGLVCS